MNLALIIFIGTFTRLTAGMDEVCHKYTDCLQVDAVTEIPSCATETSKSKLLQCTLDNLKKTEKCAEFVKKPLREFSDGVKFAEKTLCDDQQLKQEFQQKEQCWKWAVGCVAKFLNHPDKSAVGCKQSLSGVDGCEKENVKRVDCKPLHKKFVEKMVSKITCKRTSAAPPLLHSIAPFSTTRLFMALTATILVFLNVRH